MRAPLLRRWTTLLAVSVALAPLAVAQRQSPFMIEFRKLMSINSLDEMAALVKKNEDQAILAVVETCEAIGSGSSDQLENEASALDKAWRKAFNSKFVDKVYRYFALDLQPAYKKHRRELLDRYEIINKEFASAQQEKSVGKYAALGLEFNSLGDQFGELKDHYMASVCYSRYALAFGESLNAKDKADLRRECEAWGLYLQARDEIELHGHYYDEAKERFKQLEFDGFGDPSKGPEARAAARAASDVAYRPQPIEATFRIVPDIEGIQRPLYGSDSNFQIWSSVRLGGIDSSVKMDWVEGGPTLIRLGAAKLGVDGDGDGKADVEVGLTGKITPVQVSLGSGEGKRDWGFLTAIGQQRDTYQGFAFNLAPDEKQLLLYIAPAGSQVGTVNDISVQMIDDNMDGLYGTGPRQLGFLGLVQGSFQYDVDTVVVRDAKYARPWSRLQKIGDAWFTFEPGAEGKPMVATRTDVESGTLQLDMKGAPAAWMVVRGTGNNADLYYDLVSGGANKVEVPAGTYELFTGLVAQGKKAQRMKALVVPGKNARTWRVGPGETSKVELGAPFNVDFEVKQDNDTVTVVGPTVVVTGRGGETYQRLWNCVLAPEVNLRKAGSSKGKKEGKMVPITSQESLEEKNYDYDTVWFPVGEPIPKPSPGETYEVQLFEKKSKMFGKLESDWKGN